jgi:phage N-6-adenine-methyltransferase
MSEFALEPPKFRRRVEGIGRHHSAHAEKDEWLTPPEILSRLGEFDLDPCAPIYRPWSTARQHLTINDNGLTREWHGRVWLNPPYGRETSGWLARLKAHRRGTALIFARTETACWFAHVWSGATAILFLKGRLNFHHSTGIRSRKNCGAPLALIAYGSDDASRLRESGIAGHFIIP